MALKQEVHPLLIAVAMHVLCSTGSASQLILLLQQLAVYTAFRGDAESLVYLINGPILIVFTILHTSAGPFKSKAVSVIDGLLMVVLCLIVYSCSSLPGAPMRRGGLSV